MPKRLSTDEAFALARGIEGYIDRWEKVRPEADPLTKKWKEYIEKSKGKTKK